MGHTRRNNKKKNKFKEEKRKLGQLPKKEPWIHWLRRGNLGEEIEENKEVLPKV